MDNEDAFINLKSRSKYSVPIFKCQGYYVSLGYVHLFEKSPLKCQKYRVKYFSPGYLNSLAVEIKGY